MQQKSFMKKQFQNGFDTCESPFTALKTLRRGNPGTIKTRGHSSCPCLSRRTPDTRGPAPKPPEPPEPPEPASSSLMTPRCLPASSEAPPRSKASCGCFWLLITGCFVFSGLIFNSYSFTVERGWNNSRTIFKSGRQFKNRGYLKREQAKGENATSRK